MNSSYPLRQTGIQRKGESTQLVIMIRLMGLEGYRDPGNLGGDNEASTGNSQTSSWEYARSRNLRGQQRMIFELNSVRYALLWACHGNSSVPFIVCPVTPLQTLPLPCPARPLCQCLTMLSRNLIILLRCHERERFTFILCSSPARNEVLHLK